MRSFDLDAAKRGEKVCLRDGTIYDNETSLINEVEELL